MTQLKKNRSQLLLGTGATALALALAMAPDAALAQAAQATPNVVLGNASVDRTVAGEDTIGIFDPTVVIDWTPDEDNAGNALDFLPINTAMIFEDPEALGDYSVLNRILPSTNGNIAVIDGTVVSFVTDPNSGAILRGGFVAFYSPTGILIGNNALFDVGSLMLTTLDPDPANFGAFSSGTALTLTGGTGTTAPIIISPGAGILALEENSFFVAAAAEVQMFGTALVNGSHAYVGGEVVNLTITNGLFDIQIPVGSLSPTPIVMDGDVGGPSSAGAGDNHMIYAVAQAQLDPISMIFRGNLGFDPAASAGIVNGEIILSANYNVSGRSVDGGTISDGINAVFDGTGDTSFAGDIFIEDVDSLSSILAISTNLVQVSAINGPSFIDGNLLMVGRNTADLTASNGQTFDITGDVLVSARDFGVVGGNLDVPDDINALAGFARIEAFGGGTLNISGSALVDASAFAGADLDILQAGTASGGSATIAASAGNLNIAGDAEARANALGSTQAGVLLGAASTGGNATTFVQTGGLMTIGQGLVVEAVALGANGDPINTSTASDAFGGFAGLQNFGGGITIGSDVIVDSSAFAGFSNSTGPGGLADAGDTSLFIDGAHSIDIGGAVTLDSSAIGGDNASGAGGDALGGAARAFIINGGTLTIGGDFFSAGEAIGGDGTSGGNALGGIAGANVIAGSIDLQSNAFSTTSAFGGNAAFGFGGIGGNASGGNAFFQADGTLTETGVLTIAGDATVLADGLGGTGGVGDGDAVFPGRGGDGSGGDISIPNQADPMFGSGVYLVAGGDNGTLTIAGTSLASSSGTGGDGGTGGVGQDGGDGGDGVGGTAQAGLALFTGNGSVALGSSTFAGVQVLAKGTGGFGGSGGSATSLVGNGGIGTGGGAFLTSRAGSVDATAIDLIADGTGGDGNVGGAGNGGQAAVLGSVGGSTTTGGLLVSGIGTGGTGDTTGGTGSGNLALISLIDADLSVTGSTAVDASAFAGGGPTGGNAIGGLAQLVMDGASSANLSAMNLAAAATGILGGTAEGGEATIELGPQGTPLLSLDDLTLDVDAFAADPGSNIAGQFEVIVQSGRIETVNLTATALGDVPSGILAPSSLDVTGEAFAISGTALIDVTDDFLINTGQGSLIGGPSVVAPTADISITSQGTVLITGDDDNLISFGGQSLAINAFEIDIEFGARIGAQTMVFTSLDTLHTAILGGTTEEVGFTLTQEEAGRIEVGEFTFNGPAIESSDPNLPDILLRDITVFGSLDDGASSISILADPVVGLVRVEGVVAYVDTASTDQFLIGAGERIEVVTPGGIGVVDPSGAPGGILSLEAGNIWVADADLVALLQEDAQYSGRDDDLAVAFAGSDDPLGYLRGGTVQIGVNQSLLVRNTGTEFEQGGILVGDGGLSIRGISTDAGPPGELDVFAYGRRQSPTGSFVTGEAFFDEVNFNMASTGGTAYTSIAEFNDCLIVDSDCFVTGFPGSEIEESSPPVNNPTVVVAPVNNIVTLPPSEGESNAAFGIDFPGLIETPLLSDDPLLDDPVASGGDTSLYGQGEGSEDGDDNGEGDDNEQ